MRFVSIYSIQNCRKPGMLHELTEGEDDLYELVQYVCINGQSAVTAILPKIL